ncbi:ABC transporter permease [Olivibacter jilunii]|uniref:ABC transporter permease n=1 Tax=Olivibacter jilunii TaxID=985016 RepID=UPI003F5CE09A
MMLKNYIKIAWRNLASNKFYSLINIGGLAIGLATAILLLIWVQDEKSYDRFHQDYQSIYRLNSTFDVNGKKSSWEGVPAPLAVFARNIPEVKHLVRIATDVDQILSTSDRSKIMDGHTTAFVDSTFFSVFSFHLLAGDTMKPFPDIQSAIITESTAKKFFGSTDVLGKPLRFRGELFTVSGILADFPVNSSIRFDALFPMEFKATKFTQDGGNGDWKTIDTDLGNFNYITFVKLRNGAHAEKVAAMFSSSYSKARNGEVEVDFKLQSLAKIHLVSIAGNDSAAKMVDIFRLVAILILLIAAVNYINLATARVLNRLKEISVRKVIGAEKRQLFWQFIFETLPLFLIAILTATLLLFLLKSFYYNISGKPLSFTLNNYQLWLTLILASSGTFIASTIYPALLLSSLNPIKSLKGALSKKFDKAFLRKSLVTFQFTTSIILIVATLVIGKQIHYIQRQDLGYDKSYVFTVPLTWGIVEHIDAIKNDLKQEASILNVALSGIYDLSEMNDATSDIEWQGKAVDNKMMIGQSVIDNQFIPTMGIKLLEGRNFTGTPTDSNLYILNESAVKEMGLKPPYTGQSIVYHGKKGYIQGIVKDFHFKSLKEKISPLILTRQFAGNILYVRTNARNAGQAIAKVKALYQKYGEGSPFSYRFLDKQFEAKYNTDIRANMLFRAFASIAIFISCLGLLGLSTHTAQARIKEIGVRKVLGASVPSILRLLSKEPILLVILGSVIASPIAWWVMSKWLANFAYRIEIQWWYFPLAGIGAIFIALLTVSFQAIKAARANPVDSLRNE